ncbi:hypothetical protein ACWC10_20420 [Streptomyces sp. NPDC001595]|uniref:hypothetical protein n=1 Tax=Streptomyces sp. NPDC001532 TaxID=3154520 RepID=UPI003316C9B9
MTDLIRHLAAWLGLLREERLAPVFPAPSAPQPEPLPPLPLHRSPYGLDTPLDGAATVAVRPYLVLHELRQGWAESVREVA